MPLGNQAQGLLPSGGAASAPGWALQGPEGNGTAVGEAAVSRKRTVVSELVEIREGPLPRFTGSAVLRNDAVVIRKEDELALN